MYFTNRELVRVDVGSAWPLADDSVDLVLGSPPYLSARRYFERREACPPSWWTLLRERSGWTHGVDPDGGEWLDPGVARSRLTDWLDWMMAVSREAARVSRGLVLWVVAGRTSDHAYHPAPEALAWEWVRRGGELWPPTYWRRVGIPGSGGAQRFRPDVETVVGLKGCRGPIPWADPLADAKAPVCGPGNGVFRHRRSSDDRRIDSDRSVNASNLALANPGNLIDTGSAGGGKLGHRLVHQNEAPFPLVLAERLIRAFCPPDGLVLDPFCGSGTTLHAALKHDRQGLGFDIRPSQLFLTRTRLNDVRDRRGRLFECMNERQRQFSQHVKGGA